MRFIWIAYLAVSCSFFSSLHAELLGIDLKWTNGYRHDELSTEMKQADLTTDWTKTNSLSFYQMGAKGKVSILDFFIRLDASYGWLNKGKVKDQIVITSSLEDLTYLKSALRKGRIKEATIGIGYQFTFIPFYSCFSIGPALGWSIQEQHLKTSRLAPSYKGSSLQKLTCKNRLRGPWIGVEFDSRFSQLSLTASYEYHLAFWKGKKGASIPSLDLEDLSKFYRSNHVNGQVLALDGRWHFNLCWYIGIGVKLQKWKGKDGHVDAISLAVRQTSSTDEKVKAAKWQSWAVTFDIGFNI